MEEEGGGLWQGWERVGVQESDLLVQERLVAAAHVMVLRPAIKWPTTGLLGASGGAEASSWARREDEAPRMLT